MYVFTCPSPVCSTSITEPTADELTGALLTHMRVKHHLAQPTKSIAAYVLANCVREDIPQPAGAAR